MKINQLKSIHDWIRSANTSEILFVSALVLPIYLILYNTAFNQIGNNWVKYKDLGLIVALLLYIIGIIWMKNSQSKNERNLTDILVLKNSILDKGFKYMSFEKLLDIDKKFTEEKIKNLIFIFPNDLRLAKLKENRRGIKVLNIEEEN